MDIIFLIIIAAVSIWIAWMFRQRKRSNFPPGPTFRIPILGHLPLLGKYPYKKLLEWRETYGPIVGLRFGGFPVVAISEESLIREAAGLSSFAGRPTTEFFREWGGGGDYAKGIILSQGVHWAEQRKFAIKNLRALGTGAAFMEAIIQHEILELIEELKGKRGEPLRMQTVFELPAAKIIYTAIMNAPSTEGTDEELQSVLLSITRIAIEFKLAVGLASFLPWFSKWAPSLSGMAAVKTRLRGIRDFMRRKAEEHDKSRPNIPRDFTDTYLEKMASTKDPESGFHPKHKTIVNVLQDLTGGGAETTNSVLTWMLLYVLKWPEVQEKLHQEIDRVVGTQRCPSLNDRSQMPYTVALICETLRYCNIFPLSVFHSAMEDTVFLGYHIPKGTFVVLNLYAAHFDKAVWGDPENFRPERFLEESSGGNNIVNKDHLLPFSAGKRACIGEILAWDELFLFTAQLFQVFEVRAAGELPSLDGVLGVTLSARPFDILFETRSAQ